MTSGYFPVVFLNIQKYAFALTMQRDCQIFKMIITFENRIIIEEFRHGTQNSSCCSTTPFRVLIYDVFLSLIVGYLAQLETSVDRLYSKLDRLIEVMFIYVKNRVGPEAAILMKEAWESDDNSNKRIRNKYKN